MIKRLLTLPSARLLLAVSVSLGLAGGGLIIMEAFGIARITHHVFLEGQSLTEQLPELWMLLGIILLRVLAQIGSEHASVRMAVLVKGDLRKRLLHKLVELGPQAAKQEKSGEWLTTLMEGVEHLEAFLARYIPQMALSTLIPAAIWCAAVGLDLVSSIILAVTLPLLILFMILVGSAASAATRKQYKKLGLLGGHFYDVLKGLPTLRIFNRSREQIRIIGRISDEHRKATVATLRIAFLSAFVMELFATLGTAMVAVFLGLRLIEGTVGFYNAYAVLLLAPEFYTPVRALGVQFHNGMEGRMSAERIFELLDMEAPGWTERPDAVALQEDGGTGGGFRIVLEEVTVRYPGAEQPALSDVSFVVEPGQKIALVGPTGAGKSTLLDLLQGYIRPSSGRITVNGTDMAELSMAWWRSQLAVVAQRTHLFRGSVLDNLRLGRPDATLDEVREAARRAQADEFIQALPQGYDTPITEAVRLSGGQMQRLSIARALLKGAPIVLLDEPTSQLDRVNDALVRKAWQELSIGRTVIMVAHRLDTVMSADMVLVLREGRIVEVGPPGELLSLDGEFAAMWKAAREDGPVRRADSAYDTDRVSLEENSHHDRVPGKEGVRS